MELPWIINRYKLSLAIIVFLVLLSPLWVYNNRFAILNQLFPFDDFSNKVVVDGIDIIDYYERADIDEIYMVDTVINSIRQLTNDNYLDKHPNISFLDNRIYFVSNRFINQGKPYGRDPSSIFFYDLSEREIYSAYPRLMNLITDSTSNIKDLVINDGLISFIEYVDGIHKVKIGRLDPNELISEHEVSELSVIVELGKSGITIKERGQLRTIEYEANIVYE